MIKYIYNSDGNYVGYIYNELYCFSNTNEYIGFMNGIDLYDYSGKYMGYLTSDDRIIRNINEEKPNISPVNKPLSPLEPLTPFKRFKMGSLGNGYVDVFLNKNININYGEFDNKFSKFLNSKLYASDGNFLGNINLNKYDQNSISNQYGIYGSQYSQNSIFNKYCEYGSQYSEKSPFNKYSNTPLFIKDKNNNTIGIISDNEFIDNEFIDKEIINATDFFNWFKSKLK